MEFIDYYGILDIDKHATGEEISKAYRKLARRYHPDVNPGDKIAEARYKEINEAHEVLNHPEARAVYDRLSVKWNFHQNSEADADFDWGEWLTVFDADDTEADLDSILSRIRQNSTDGYSEFYHALFEGVISEPEEPVSARGEDYNQQVEISLQEAFTGAARVLQVGKRRLEVRVPRGARTGTKIRVRGEGGEGIGDGPRGDLYLEIMVTPDPTFERIGDDLHLELPVNVYSAVLGGEAILPTLKGKIKLKIPPETQSGKVFRIKSQGMPKIQSPDERGDLYAKVMITVPENLSEEEIELFEELADIRGL